MSHDVPKEVIDEMVKDVTREVTSKVYRRETKKSIIENLVTIGSVLGSAIFLYVTITGSVKEDIKANLEKVEIKITTESHNAAKYHLSDLEFRKRQLLSIKRNFEKRNEIPPLYIDDELDGLVDQIDDVEKQWLKR